ncbi:MAG: hypothetical protein K2Y13_04720 [Burkholderiaceae bacterium]|nr:hypothetical protein [Burkholderiaceae bacterium]MBY0243548.1 hypothetical protein [Burkholderiaceae bacterium]
MSRISSESVIDPKACILPLPEASFVPFDVQKLAHPHIEWVNSLIGDSELFNSNDFGYCVPIMGDEPRMYLPVFKKYSAERYGGDGIGSNGGGARCGLASGVQVKGIGANLLVGTVTDYWHSHGGAALEEGVQEAIWAEVCHIALPYGAARVHSLISTGTMTPYRCFLGDSITRRALIIREPALRPAHYMRAIFHHPNQEMRQRYSNDVFRTKTAVGAITDGLAAAFGARQGKQSDADYINQCLREMCERFACQAATARAKRIMHGTLNASNICLDGRWIDFGTISTLSDYGRIKLGRNQQSDLWLQHLSLLGPISDLIFYLRKYLPLHIAKSILHAKDFSDVYLNKYNDRLMIETLKLIGVREVHFSEIEKNHLHRLYVCMQKIILTGNKEPFKLDYPGDWEMPVVTGKYHLNTILVYAAFCIDEESTFTSLATILSDIDLREEFVSAYWAVKEAFLAGLEPTARANALVFTALNALRLNTSFPELYRTNFEATLKSVVSEGGNLEEYIEKLLRKARMLLSEPHDEMIDLSLWFTSTVEVSEHIGILSNASPTTLNNLLDIIQEEVFTPEQAKLAKIYAEYITSL